MRRVSASLAIDSALRSCSFIQRSSIADSTLRIVCKSDSVFAFTVDSIDRLTLQPTTAKTTMAMIGHTQSCRFRNSFVVEIDCETLREAHVIWPAP
jgi:hypothetical protein